MKRKHLTETPVCPQERLVIISYTTGLSFALKRISPLVAIIIIVFYLLILYLLALPNTPEKPFASIYSESLIKTACQHLLFLIGFDTLIYRKYYDTPPVLVGHHWPSSKDWIRRSSCYSPVVGKLPNFKDEVLFKGRGCNIPALRDSKRVEYSCVHCIHAYKI
jgi:hypothetical protein